MALITRFPKLLILIIMTYRLPLAVPIHWFTGSTTAKTKTTDRNEVVIEIESRPMAKQESERII